MIYFISILALVTAIYFFSMGWIIVGFNKLKRNKEIRVEENKANKITVIIPVRNEENNILDCLQSLQNLKYDKEHFEVIVVNDHSTDASEKIAANFKRESDLDMHLISLSDKSSKKEALKYGVEVAKFDIIATTDADCVLPEKWLENISIQFNNNVDMLLGPIIFKKSKGFLSAFQQLDMMAMQSVTFGMLGLQRPILNNAANLAYLKSTYNAVNGFDSFDTPSGDDVFLLEKFNSKRRLIKGLLNDSFIVETSVESTFSGFLNQRLRWASKSKYYKGKLLLFISTITLVQNLALLFIYFGILLVEKYSIFLVILLFSKWLIDFILLFLVTSFFKRKSELVYFIPVQLVYPIYIVVIWGASMTKKFDWKGRKY